VPGTSVHGPAANESGKAVRAEQQAVLDEAVTWDHLVLHQTALVPTNVQGVISMRQQVRTMMALGIKPMALVTKRRQQQTHRQQHQGHASHQNVNKKWLHAWHQPHLP
jgi:hypothetical protein